MTQAMPRYGQQYSGYGERNIGRSEQMTPYHEGRVASAIEHRTAQVPSDLFLWAAGASIAGSLTLRMMGRTEDALFVGQWAPTLLILGTYNKMVKLLGSE